jgi:UDP-3-O-[3-hydroxymyristoyl] glucosamine N-acyltransferase
MTLRDIARALDAEILLPAGMNESREIRRVAKIEEAGEGDITFIANPKYAQYITATRASAVIVARSFKEPESGWQGPKPALLRVDDPYVSFLNVLQRFSPPHAPLPPGIHPSAVIAPTATLGTDVRVGAHAVIGDGCRIGDRAMIGHGTVLGEQVSCGPETLLHANVTVREGCSIGTRCIVHSGTVIGSDGFGFAPKADGTYEKIPQLGIVVIEDDVEVGSNCSIDRATMGETRIKKGAKLDNLIQVAHNVVIGENTVIAAQTGISGSTKLGKNCMIGGQVGFTGHISIADGTKVGAQSGVHKTIADTGTSIFGSPALPTREAFRIQGAATQLPDLLAAVRRLQQEVERLSTTGTPDGDPERRTA